jgi:mRNA degradation ribonuclease J1/J2
VEDLPILLKGVNGSDMLNIYCTRECHNQIVNMFPQFAESRSAVSFRSIQADESFELGPFSVTAVLADHGENSPPGSLIYILRIQDRKIICGWDFQLLPNLDEKIFCNPDLLILGTPSYNPHPEKTGMISATHAYQLVRRWNAKEC